MAIRPRHDILERQPWAASSRNAVIERCSQILNGDFMADKDILPRSGPWAHHLVDPHKALRKTTGRFACLPPVPLRFLLVHLNALIAQFVAPLGHHRSFNVLCTLHQIMPVLSWYSTEHKDAWRVGFVENKKKEYSTMAR